MLEFISDNQKAGLLILPIALLGTVCNWSVFTLAITSTTFHHSFGRLTAAQSLGDALHSTLFLTYFFPMAFFHIELLIQYSHFLRQGLLVAYDVSTLMHLCISANRFSFLVLPNKSFFKPNFTNLLIILSYSLAIVPSIYQYNYRDCKAMIDDYYWTMFPNTNPICAQISYYLTYLPHLLIIPFAAGVDVVTLIVVYFQNRHNHHLKSASHLKRLRLEINFLKQANLQAFVFVSELFLYFVINPFFSSNPRWLRYFCSTMAWATAHMMGGVITILWNPEFRQVLLKRNLKIDAIMVQPTASTVIAIRN